MTITAESLSIRRQQVCILDLIKKKNWLSHGIGMDNVEEYQQRIAWLHENLGEPFNEFENLDLSFAHRWFSAPTTSAGGLINGAIVAFREDADRTMFVLRWA